MAAPQTVEEAIEQNALGPASVTIAGETVTAKDIDQIIRADQYLAAKRAQRVRGLGITCQQIVSGGTG